MSKNIKVNKVNTIKDIIGPQSTQTVAELYITSPEKLSHDVRTILGYVYRNFIFDAKRNGYKASFSAYALNKWKRDEFPRDALV